MGVNNINYNSRELRRISPDKISPVFALNYLGTLETVNFIISSLRETLVRSCTRRQPKLFLLEPALRSLHVLFKKIVEAS